MDAFIYFPYQVSGSLRILVSLKYIRKAPLHMRKCTGASPWQQSFSYFPEAALCCRFVAKNSSLMQRSSTLTREDKLLRWIVLPRAVIINQFGDSYFSSEGKVTCRERINAGVATNLGSRKIEIQCAIVVQLMRKYGKWTWIDGQRLGVQIFSRKSKVILSCSNGVAEERGAV